MNQLAQHFATKKQIKSASKIELPASFQEAFPDLTAKKSQAIFNRYLDAIKQQVIPYVVHSSDGTLNVSTKALLDTSGEFQYKNKRYWVWNELKDRYPFFTVLEIGSNLTGKKSLVRLNNRTIQMLIDQMTAKEIHDKYIDPEAEYDDLVIIDMDNLKNYIDHTNRALTGELAAHTRTQFERALNQAQIVYAIGAHTEETTGTAHLPMATKRSIFGRVFYSGFSIQSLTKAVRQAVIGPHYQYDINAAVYGIKLGLFNAIRGGEWQVIGTQEGTYTREYLSDKKAIRRRLADHCFAGTKLTTAHRVEIIKQALTAISFGARLNTGYYSGDGDKQPALKEIFTSPYALSAFVEDEWVKKFIAEQTVIDDAIYTYYEARGAVDDYKTQIRAAKPNQKRISKAMVLSYIYQHQETGCMDIIRQYVPAEDIICFVHDAVMTKRKLTQDELENVYGDWSKHLTEFLKLDEEQKRGWWTIEEHEAYEKRKAALAADDIRIQEHKAFIKRQSYEARELFETMGTNLFAEHQVEEDDLVMDLEQTWNWVIRKLVTGSDISNHFRVNDLREIYGFGFEEEVERRIADYQARI